MFKNFLRRKIKYLLFILINFFIKHERIKNFASKILNKTPGLKNKIKQIIMDTSSSVNGDIFCNAKDFDEEFIEKKLRRMCKVFRDSQKFF
jgi:hypothetical protein